MANTPHAPGKPTQIAAIHQAYSGPLPEPSSFRAYNETLPGAAERILAMAERQSAHRQGLERREQLIEALLSILGMASAFVITIAAIVGAIWCIYAGRQVSGTILGGVGLAVVISLFIAGRRAAHGKKPD